MAKKNRITHTQTFGGGMNSDAAREYMKNYQSRYQLNVHSLSTAEGDVGIIRNVMGNTLISVNLPVGVNKFIGYARDEERHKFYSFIFNDQGFHGIYEYDEISNSIRRVMQSITDTGGFDVLKFSKDYLILMTQIIQGGKLLYWVDGLNDARKINIKKAFDKSALGYGPNILEEYINAYKLAPSHAPVATYFSDPAVLANYQYGSLKKFNARFYYDDSERSHFSDFSNVALPPKESFTGVNTIPTDNNGIGISVETGSRIVTKIEIGMQRTIETGLSEWVSIAILDKKKLKIADDSIYVYKFYNDGKYAAIDPEKVVKPYSFLPKAPLCQAFAGVAMTYTNFKDGFETVEIDTEIEVSYEDLFIDSGIGNEFNKPAFTFGVIDGAAAYLYNRNLNHGQYRDLDDSLHFVSADKRANSHRITIGQDVKKGNVYTGNISNGSRSVSISYTANVTDTATTVANELKQQLLNKFGGNGGNIIKQIMGNVKPAETQVARFIYLNSDDGFGNISFEFAIIDYPSSGYYGSTGSVTPVQYNTLKDTGQSVSNTKLGSGRKYGIMYEDFQGRRSLVYTQDALITKVATQNALGGIKSVVFTLTIKHRPPIWAKYYQIVRTDDLVYGSLIQMNIQKVISVPATNSGGDYLDLAVGSLYTYQKIHPNATLKYGFKKGDRVRFLTKANGSYYPFIESEVLSFKDTTDEVINSNVVVNGSDTVTVASASADNVGRFIVIDNNEREILAAPSGTTYTLSAPIGKAATDPFLSYRIIDRRGLLRIRKPSASLVANIENNSLVEIFTPALSGGELGDKQFFHFNKKFDIINAGTANRYHSANQQQQDATHNAIVRITEGSIYVRNRELPLTNTVPNAQVDIRAVEDESYSDFYQSLINDNGRDNIEDTGNGVVDFGSRSVFSNNYIEDTRINGLNDFDALDRKDYNDPYGDIKLTVFTESKILIFKELKDCWTGVFKNIITDNNGTDILGVSSKLLNDLNYYTHEGGIGNNPESYCSHSNWHYHASTNSGVVIRLAADGATPISEVYELDKAVKEYLMKAGINNANIYMQVDPKIGVVVAIEEAESRTFYGGFDESKWLLFANYISDNGVFVVLTAPTHGTVSVVNGLGKYVANPDYVGDDSFIYSTVVNGVTIVRKVCIKAYEPANREKAWRQKESSFICTIVDSKRNGYKGWATLEEYFLDDGSLTGNEKANNPSDPNYVSPIFDDVACTIQFGNEPYSQNFTRNNCGSGYIGSVVPYIVLANTFFADSQAAANALAAADAATNGQNYANSNGTCTVAVVWNELQSQNFVKNTCLYGQEGTSVTYSVPAHTYSASTLAAANQLALDDIAANGQNYANTHGTCINIALDGKWVIDETADYCEDVLLTAILSNESTANVVSVEYSGGVSSGNYSGVYAPGSTIEFGDSFLVGTTLMGIVINKLVGGTAKYTLTTVLNGAELNVSEYTSSTFTPVHLTTNALPPLEAGDILELILTEEIL